MGGQVTTNHDATTGFAPLRNPVFSYPLCSAAVICYNRSMPKTTTTSPKKLLIIDAHALIHRAYHALPPLTNKEGVPTGAVYGFIRILLSVLADMKPEYVAVTFDSKGKTFRHEMYKEYKANRDAPDDDLVAQFPIVEHVVEAFDFPIYKEIGYEADDLIGTICKQFDNDGSVETLILTGDMDLVQLVDKDTKVMRLHKGVKETLLFDEATVKAHTGLRPDQITDYKGLRGDSSDNIPGVKGIGEKGAVELLQQYDTIEGVYDNLEHITGRNRKPLEGTKDDAVLSKKLATIVQDAPIQFVLEDAVAGPYSESKLAKIFKQFEFTSLLPQLLKLPGLEIKEGLFADPVDEAEEEQRRAKFDYTLVDTTKAVDALVAKLQKQKVFAFDTETTGLNSLQDDLVGISISWKAEEGYYIPCPDNTVPKKLAAIFEDESIKKTAHNMKFDIHALLRAGVETRGVAFDSMIASYVLNAGTRGHGLDNLALVEFGHEMQPITELIGKGKSQISMADVPVDKVSWYACEDADFTWRLYEVLSERMAKSPMRKLFETIEIPTINALLTIEENGVRVDVNFLHEMSKKLHRRTKTLEQRIHTDAGVEFNVASSTQMREVLYDKLGLPTKGIKKTKSGFSTAAPELAKLQGTHTIIPLIEECRELTKLTSTYIDALPRLVNPRTGRIHTTYSQTIAATGRLSSNDPNLQNIPIRTELGRSIRQAFVADRGKRILALDYSQVELRVVAHLAQDAVMIEAFRNGEDIHTRTAAELNDIPTADVTKDMRRQSKAINFGILYGMGVQGIMRDSGVPREEAQMFLDKYFTVHTGIHTYIERIKEETHANGYAETLFGRRRALPDIQSKNRGLVAAAERAAVNMPVQGTAADIMKMAMIAVHNAIATGKIDATMLLQVHDELVFEVESKKIDSEAAKIQKIMENIYALDVPLSVDVEAGMNWGELKPL